MADLLAFPSALPDAAEREQALDITQSWIVEAPAGSGKTGLILQRFLKLLASDSVTDPAQILAITFTKKATAELQERVQHQLADAHAGLPPKDAFAQSTRIMAEAVLARDAQLGWNLLDSSRRLNVRTIDSVCAEIAGSLPILSGSGGGQSPSEDGPILHAQAAHRTLMLLGGPDQALNQALELLLLHRDGNLADCERLIATMLATRDQWGDLVPLGAEQLTDQYLEETVLPRLQKALELTICRGLTRLSQILPAPTLSRLCRLAEEMAHADGYKGAASPIALCRHLHNPPADRAEDLEHWRALIHLIVKPSKPRDWRKSISANHIGFEILKHHQADLKQIIAELSGNTALLDELCRIDSLPPAVYPPEQWIVTKALFRVLSRALVELQLVFAAVAECDFAEIGLQARAALRRDSALEDLRSANLSLQHLLVDEMQDTSSGQYELLELLTQRWDGHSQTLFLVGDPKQSIYMFRQARVERFVRTMHGGHLGDVPLGTLHLTANFRSQQTLVADFNDDFARLFPALPDPLNPELVPFRHAAPTRAATQAAARVWHATALPYSAEPDECRAFRVARSRQDAGEIAAILQDTKPRTAAVLVRNRTHLLDIVKAFQAARIPYRAVEIEPLAERQEILDLLALTRALLHPADRTATLAILRAPWCGLALGDLHTLAGQDDPAFHDTPVLDLIRDRGELLSDDGIARIQPMWNILTAAYRQRGRLSLGSWVERTWRALGAPAFLPPEALANAESFFGLLTKLEERTGSVDLTRLDAKLLKLYAAPTVHPAAVDLMTIHGAKGLEWDTVFVPALERSGQANRGGLLSWLEVDNDEDPTVAPGILAPIQGKGQDSAMLNQWMRSVESDRETAERKRLFYVACTRAQEALHLFAAPARKKDGEISRRADTLLAAAWHAAEAHFADQPATGAPPSAAPSLRVGSTIVPFPTPVILETLAAEGKQTPRLILRIPTGDIPGALAAPVPEQVAKPHFTRPQGSFAARAFGNAMHAFLDLLTTKVAAGEPLAALAMEVATWSTRIETVLRGSGLPASQVQRHTANVVRGLTNTLTDPVGRWLLSNHLQSSSESALSTVDGTLWLDRTFLAADTPGAKGETHRWIVDYKTGSHGETNVQAFLASEKAKYVAQLDTYAEALPDGPPIRLALYYPLLPSLVWWEYSPERPDASLE